MGDWEDIFGEGVSVDSVIADIERGNRVDDEEEYFSSRGRRIYWREFRKLDRRGLLPRSQSPLLAVSAPRGLADLLGVKYSLLVRLVYRTPASDKYRTFDIPKKPSGRRIIEAPNDELKMLQRRLSSLLYHLHAPRFCAHGFLPRRGIVSNALPHIGRRYVGNIDLQNFFGSINFGRVRGLFLAMPYELPERVATLLAQICCHKNALPQGAPTSPVIANMIATMLDKQLEKLAAAFECRYTRYADDLTFSTYRRVFPQELLEPRGRNRAVVGDALAAVLRQQGFRANPDKVRLAGTYTRQEVTGLVVNRKLNVRRRFIRQLRAMVHALEKYGADRATSEHYLKYSKSERLRGRDVARPALSDIIEGKLEFLRSILGAESLVYLNLLRRYCIAATGRPEPILAVPLKPLMFLEQETRPQSSDEKMPTAVGARAPAQEALKQKQAELEAELERRPPGSVQRLPDGTQMVSRQRGQDPDLDEAFEALLQELARRSGTARTEPTVRVKEGDWVTVDGYRLRVGKVGRTGMANLELLDESCHVVASCPTDASRLVADAPGAAPAIPKPVPSGARGRRILIENLVDMLEA